MVGFYGFTWIYKPTRFMWHVRFLLSQHIAARSNGRFGAGGRVPPEPQAGRELWMTGRGDGQIREDFGHSDGGKTCSYCRRRSTVLVRQLLGV